MRMWSVLYWNVKMHEEIVLKKSNEWWQISCYQFLPGNIVLFSWVQQIIFTLRMLLPTFLVKPVRKIAFNYQPLPRETQNILSKPGPYHTWVYIQKNTKTFHVILLQYHEWNRTSLSKYRDTPAINLMESWDTTLLLMRTNAQLGCTWIYIRNKLRETVCF